jgi:hypothetical protein
MIFRWQSARMAWILLVGVGVGALYLNNRVRSLEEDLQDAQQWRDAAVVRTRRLEDEVRHALDQKNAMAVAVRETVEDRDRREQEQEERMRAATKPMPEGVRVALVTLQDCLRYDGYRGLRLLRARAIVDQTLTDVEMIHYDQGQLASTLYVAGRMELVLDRSSSTVTLRLFDGHLLHQGEQESFPPEGFEYLVPGVDGPMWESRLPFLIKAVETYPEEDQAVAASNTLDPISRRQWQDRLDRLLDESSTVEQMRIGNVSALVDGVFRDVLLLGYDHRSLLVMSANAARMVVRVDEEGNFVQLVLTEGVLRRKGGETAIGEAGYRILLPDVTPQRARDIMMGMVAER